jgi:cell division protein FtsW (lipid II flippase)
VSRVRIAMEAGLTTLGLAAIAAVLILSALRWPLVVFGLVSVGYLVCAFLAAYSEIKRYRTTRTHRWDR